MYHLLITVVLGSQGWNKKWDEWVEETGVRKCPEVAVPGTLQTVRRNGGKANGHPNGNGHSDSMFKSKKRKADELSDTSLQVRINCNLLQSEVLEVNIYYATYMSTGLQ